MPSLYYYEPAQTIQEEFYVIEEEPSGRRRRRRRSKRYQKKRKIHNADYFVEMGGDRFIDYDDNRIEADYFEEFEPIEVVRGRSGQRPVYIKDRFVVQEPAADRVFYAEKDARYNYGNKKSYRSSRRHSDRHKHVYIVEDDPYLVSRESGRGRRQYSFGSKSFVKDVIIDPRSWNLPVPPVKSLQQQESNTRAITSTGERILSIIAQPPVISNRQKRDVIGEAGNVEGTHNYSRGSTNLEKSEYNQYGESNEEAFNMTGDRVISVISQSPVKKDYEKWSFIGDAPDFKRTESYSRGSVEDKVRSDQLAYSTLQNSKFENKNKAKNDRVVKYITTKEIRNGNRAVSNNDKTLENTYSQEYAEVNKSRKTFKKGRGAEVYDRINFNSSGEQPDLAKFNEYPGEIYATSDSGRTSRVKRQKLPKGNENAVMTRSSNSQKSTGSKQKKQVIIESPLHSHEVQDTGTEDWERVAYKVADDEIIKSSEQQKQQQTNKSRVEKDLEEWMQDQRTMKRTIGGLQTIPAEPLTVRSGSRIGLTPPLRRPHTDTDLVVPQYDMELSGLKSKNGYYNNSYNDGIDGQQLLGDYNGIGVDQTDVGTLKNQQQPTFLERVKDKMTPSPAHKSRKEENESEMGDDERPFGQGKYRGK